MATSLKLKHLSCRVTLSILDNNKPTYTRHSVIYLYVYVEYIYNIYHYKTKITIESISMHVCNILMIIPNIFTYICTYIVHKYYNW